MMLMLALLALPACPRQQPLAPDTRPTAPDAAPPRVGTPLIVAGISFAGPAGHRKDARFSRGELPLCLFTVANFVYRAGQAHIVADITVRGPTGQVVLLQPNRELLKGRAPTARPGTIRSMAKLSLTPAAPAGSYTVELKLRDLLSGRVGQGRGKFTLLGTAPKKGQRLTIDEARLVGDSAVPPGSAVPVLLYLRGISARQQKETYRLHLGIRPRLLNKAGKTVYAPKQEDLLLRRSYAFRPLGHPVEYVVRVPASLPPGKYTLALEVSDHEGGDARASARLALSLVPRTLAIHNLHAHDASFLSRTGFLLGEQVYVRLAVHGLKVRAGQVAAAVDLGIIGPHGDQHMARQGAATISGAKSARVAQAGRYPVQLPLVLPSLAPTGAYRLVVRARDLNARRTVQRELKIRLTGDAPRPLGRFKVDDLEVTVRPDLPPLKGDTFGAGRSYNLSLKLGGIKPEELGRRRYRVRVLGSLSLRSTKGKELHRQDKLFKLDQVMTYRPLRLLIPARWTVPAGLPGGLYDLNVTVESLHDRQVSQFMRRVEILPGR